MSSAVVVVGRARRYIAPDVHRKTTLRQMANVRTAPSRARATGAAGERTCGRCFGSPGGDYFFGAGVAVNSPLTSNGFTSIVPFISFAEGSVPV